MNQQQYRRRIQRRRRLIRRLVRFVCRCFIICLLAIAVVISVKIYKNKNDVIPAELGEEYPESLIALYEKNPEARQFVLDYLENKDKHAEIDLSGEVAEGVIPLFLQWDERWGYETYGNDFLAVTGCGPTCLAMVRCGLGGDTEWNPYAVAEMAEREGYYVQGSGSSWDLMKGGAESLGLTVNEVTFDKEHILSELYAGNPIICVMRPGDFTTTGHFIVLSEVKEDGSIVVCDPNSKVNSEKTWDVEKLIPQIKNLWSYDHNSFCG